MPQDTQLTISVPEAGKRLAGLSRNASYAAAARGDFPVIKVGKLLRDAGQPVRMPSHKKPVTGPLAVKGLSSTSPSKKRL